MKLSQIIQAWENGETIQYQDSVSGLWVECLSYNAWLIKCNEYNRVIPSYYGTKYRIKPRTLSINGIEFPAPLKKPPEIGTEYFTAGSLDQVKVWHYSWGGHSSDYERLTRGIVHLTRESAMAHLHALIRAGQS